MIEITSSYSKEKGHMSWNVIWVRNIWMKLSKDKDLTKHYVLSCILEFSKEQDRPLWSPNLNAVMFLSANNWCKNDFSQSLTQIFCNQYTIKSWFTLKEGPQAGTGPKALTVKIPEASNVRNWTSNNRSNHLTTSFPNSL